MTRSGYTADELEIQYNNMQRVPEAPGIIEAWTRRSAALRGQRQCDVDVAYGDGPREVLDLYRADAAGAPLLVYVHGGYWQRGDKSIYGFVAAGPLALGMNVAVINYGLCPDVGFETIAPQTARAVAWLLGRASRLGFDPDCVFVAGHSAGGHLAASMLTRDFSSIDTALRPCPLAGVLAISGVFELAPLVPTSINAALSLDDDAARRASPLLATPVDGACPVTAAVGAQESEEFLRQAADLVARWGSHTRSRYLAVPDGNHFTVLEALADPRGALTGALADLAAAARG